MNDLKKIPNLPGMKMPDLEKENFRKTQCFKILSSAMQEKVDCSLTNDPDSVLIEQLNRSKNSGLFNSTIHKTDINSSTFQSNEAQTTDQDGTTNISWNVLRFYAYFTEQVFISQIETEVQRRVKILYFLEDDTIQMNEEKVKNSGIPQGDFLKRQKVFKDHLKPEEFFNFTDFKIGGKVTIFKRTFTIYEADEFTKKYLQSKNPDSCGSSLELPVDQFSVSVMKKNMKVHNPETKFFKEYVEVKHGGGNPNKGLEQYIQNDRKVLSFDALWNDTSFAGNQNRYKINYFLADDTIEVKEHNNPNSGKHPFPLMLKRAKLPKKMVLVHCPGMSHPKIEYYTFGDLVVGNMITIYGRDCLLYSCDEFTKTFFKEELDINQKSIRLEQDQTGKVIQRAEPAYNGFGSEQDSLGNCYHLIPKPPKLDVVNIFKYDSIVLRFICGRITGSKMDKMEQLILNFYMGDETLSIYLQTEKNSGILSGKFLERKKYKNTAKANNFFSASDFQIGGIIEVNNHSMQILSADEFTVNYMLTRPDLFPQFDLHGILKKLKETKVLGSKSLMTCAMELLVNDCGWYNFQQLTKKLQASRSGLTIEQLFVIFTQFERNGNGEISAEHLLSFLKANS